MQTALEKFSCDQLNARQTVEDAMERLYFLAKIERGLEQSEAGLGLSHEDVKKRFLG